MQHGTPNPLKIKVVKKAFHTAKKNKKGRVINSGEYLPFELQ
jgi:non-canonical (house-cleaning) NTP pyrophosphatase